MEPSTYEHINKYMLEHSKLAGWAILFDRAITAAMVVFYPAFLIWLLFNRNFNILLQCIFIPAGGFIGVSILRIILKQKRPYELFNVVSINGKTTGGRSFPSRHVFSMFMIAETYLYVSDHYSAAVFYIAGLLMMLTRVALGNHFLKDVLTGGFLALLCGVLFYI